MGAYPPLRCVISYTYSVTNKKCANACSLFTLAYLPTIPVYGIIPQNWSLLPVFRLRGLISSTKLSFDLNTAHINIPIIIMCKPKVMENPMSQVAGNAQKPTK